MPQERKEQEDEDGTKWPSAIPAHSPEVPEKWPEVPEKWPEVPDMSGSFGQLAGSSGHSKKLRKEQAQDQVLRDAGSIPFQGINDDQDEDNEDQLHEEEDQEPIQRQQLLPHPRVHQSIQRDHPVDNILGSIRRGVTTHSHLANFWEFYSLCFLFGAS